MKKEILWIDDQFIGKHRSLLEAYKNAINNYACITECCKFTEFIRHLKIKKFHGLILDVMLKREIEIENYALINEPTTRYFSTKAGIQIAEIILGLSGNPENNPALKNLKDIPILILTNECDDPKAAYNTQYSSLTNYAQENQSTLHLHSKGEPNIEESLRNWIITKVDEGDGYKLC